EQLAELRQMVIDEQACFARGDRGAGIRLSGEFHLKLAEMAKNAPLVSFQRSLVSQTSLIIAQYESGNRSHCSYDEHNQLIDAIAARDSEKAVSLMMHHMDHVDSKLNLDEDSASRHLHAVFSPIVGTNGQGPKKRCSRRVDGRSHPRGSMAWQVLERIRARRVENRFAGFPPYVWLYALRCTETPAA